MASSPIASWQIDGETMETVTDFNCLGFRIAVEGNCSHEIKRHLLPGWNAGWKVYYINLDSLLKTRHHFANKVRLVKAIVFPVVMYRCEGWTIKKAEHQRIHAFKLWCWRRLLRVPWKTMGSNESILKDISPEYLLERLKLKLQYFGHLTRRANSLEKTLMLGKIEGKRRRGWQTMRWLDGITDSVA